MEHQNSDFPHILAIPFFLKGHEIPLLHLCRHLNSLPATKITVTILRLPRGNHSWSSSSLEDSLAQGLEHVVQYEDLPLEMPPERNMGIFLKFFDRFKELGGTVAASWKHRKVTCVLTDVLVSWGRDLACELNVPWVALWTSTITELAVYSNLPRLISDDAIKGPESVVKIPGLQDLKVSDYMTLHYVMDPNFHFKFIINSFVESVRYTTQANRVLANSSHVLEANAVDALQICGVRVTPVGPLHLGDDDSNSLKDPNQVLSWLDEQETGSVLYIAFGTVSPVPEAQFEQIALALESMKSVSFLWVIRPEQLELIPPAFNGTARYALKSKQDDNNSLLYRGLLTDWVPQAVILGHRAVGGFLTHCGWNSVLESISMDVPVISMPRMADQCLTSKLLDEWGVSVRLVSDSKSVVNKPEIEAAVEELMIKRSYEVRTKVAELGARVREGMDEGGSSRLNVETLIDDLKLWNTK